MSPLPRRLPRFRPPRLPRLPRPERDAAEPTPVTLTDTEVKLAPVETERVPFGLRIAADYSWRLLVVGTVIYFVAKILAHLAQVTVPVVVALLLTALLWPGVEALVRRRVPRGLAAFLGLLSVVLVIVGVMTLVGTQIATQWNQLAVQATKSFEQVLNWLANGPFHIRDSQISAAIKSVQDWAKTSQGAIATVAASVGAQVGNFFAGAALTMFAAFFFLYQGRSFAVQGTMILPQSTRLRLMHAGRSGWNALVSYVRAAVIVAFVDGLGALIGAAAVGSNLFLAIGALTFITAFVPLIGALFAGTVATLVVLVTIGPVQAIIMLVVFTLVMQLEAHVLQPFLLGRAVSLHPLAVLFGFAIGTIVAGIAGALFTVPALAFFNAFLRALGIETADIVALEPKPDPAEPAPVDPTLDAPPLGAQASTEPGEDAPVRSGASPVQP